MKKRAVRVARWLLPAVCVALGAAPAAHAAAFTISGTVKNELGQGLSNVDIDFLDTCTGDNAFLVNDKTVSGGVFSIVVNEGTYDIRFTPPAGSTVAATDLRGFTVSANSNLGSITLLPGKLVSGVVRNTSGAAVPGVDLKFVDVTTGSKVWVTKDVTTAAGAYSARVRPGTYDIEFRPPATTTFVTSRRENVVVGVSDVTGLIDVLATGFKVDGTVKDASGATLRNVDLNFIDTCTGSKIPTANDNTDSQGRYAVFVPAGTYSVHFTPPACRTLASVRVPDVQITQNRGIGNTILEPGLHVTGRVLDDAGLPLPRAKLKFYDSASGSRLGAANDDTDENGAFDVLLPAGNYNVNVEPPVSRDLLVGRLDSVDVTGATALGDIGLVPGWPVSGRVIDAASIPVRNVNVNAVDSATRTRVILAHDASNADGSFRVVMPPGTVDVQYRPPGCTGLAPDDRKAVAIAGPTTLPDQILVQGVVASGLVVDDATPMPGAVDNVDLDFFPAGTQLKSYTPGDTTDASGTYDVLIRPGIYDIDYKPPSGSRLRPVRRAAASVVVDTILPDTVLLSGWMLSGTVRSSQSGLPVDGVRVDVHPHASTSVAWTPHNSTGVDGAFSFAVDAGTWDIEFVPPAVSGLAPHFLPGVMVSSDLALADTLLLPSTPPTVTGTTPGAGSTRGGEVVAVGGTAFQPGAIVRFGGIEAPSAVFVSSTRIDAMTPPHPAGPATVEVINPGTQAGSALAYAYVEPAVPVLIRLTKAGDDVVVSWAPTDQATYTVFRAATPAGFGASSILGATGGTTFVDIGGLGTGALAFYDVD